MCNHAPEVGSPSVRWEKIDVLRGLFLVVIAMTHSQTVFSGRVHFRLFSFTSAAEGFIFVSGLIAGLIFARRTSEQSGLRIGTLNRIWKLYRYHVITLILSISLWLLAFGMGVEFGRLRDSRLGHFAVAPRWTTLYFLTLLHQPAEMDILPLYVGMSLLLPGILYLLRRGRGLGLLMLSFSVWLLAQFGFEFTAFFVENAELDFRPGYFNFAAWQFLFVLAVWVGYSSWTRTVNFQSLTLSRVSLVIVLSCFFVELYLLLSGFYSGLIDWSVWPYYLVNTPRLGILRLINFLALAQILAAHEKRWIPHSKVLALLGRHSLPAFSLQVVLVQPLVEFTASPAWTVPSDILKVSILIFSMWMLARYREWKRPAG